MDMDMDMEEAPYVLVIRDTGEHLSYIYAPVSSCFNLFCRHENAFLVCGDGCFD